VRELHHSDHPRKNLEILTARSRRMPLGNNWKSSHELCFELQRSLHQCEVNTQRRLLHSCPAHWNIGSNHLQYQSMVLEPIRQLVLFQIHRPGKKIHLRNL
jgi:hypothetical protein